MFDTVIENNTPQNLEQFMLTQQQIYIQNLVSDLSHNRRLGNKRAKKTEQIVMGYNMIMALVDRFKA